MAASGVGAERERGEMVPDVLVRLTRWTGARIGDNPTMSNDWAVVLQADLNDAIAEVTRLRSLVGVARDGMTMAAIKRELKPSPRWIDPS